MISFLDTRSIRAAREEARDPQTTPERLAELVGHQDWRVRAAVASNPQVRPLDLAHLITDDRVEVRAALAGSPAVQPSMLRALARSPEVDVRTAVARSRLTPPDVLESLAPADAAPSIRREVAANPHTPARVLQALAVAADERTRDYASAQVRYVEGSMQTYGFRGRDRVAMGPLVVTLDLSGSTAGEVEVWEKAVAAALVLEAARTRRPARVTAFSSETPLERWDFPLGLSSAERFHRLLAMATCWLGGGTDWNQPIRAALDILAEPTWQAADLVLLTDGEAELEPAVQADVLAAEARGLRLLSVLVGRGVSPDTVVDWSTQVLTVEPTREVAATILDTVTTVPAKPPVRRRPAFR